MDGYMENHESLGDLQRAERDAEASPSDYDGRGICVNCGDPTRAGSRWCSESCRRQEDGLSPEEEAALEAMEQDE